MAIKIVETRHHHTNRITHPVKKQPMREKDPRGKGAKQRPPGLEPIKVKPATAGHKPPSVARPARAKRRHVFLVMSFLVGVVLPVLATGWYLWTRAVDQYESRVGFTIRREEAPGPADLFGRLSSLSATGSSDSDILFEYIQSQEMVRLVDTHLSLRQLYAQNYQMDPVFSLPPGGTIEDLHRFWQRMVKVSYTQGTGLIDLSVRGFTPDQAQSVAEAILEESSAMINTLSTVAQQDAMGFARSELENALDQLKRARAAITRFRSRTQIVDPNADIRMQMGLLTNLQQQLGEELIAHDMLLENTQASDPRITRSKQRIAAIEGRIRQERQKFSIGGDAANGEDYATMISEFERLSVDREFAEAKYTRALTNFDLAQAEAQRQSRYLATYVQPTLAESAQFPRRGMLLGLVTLFLLTGWAIFALIYYALRDRR